MKKSEECNLILSFSSLLPMDKKPCSNSVLQLGKKIVKELNEHEKVGTLERWMAHYIASKIEAAESSTDETRSEKESDCCEEILKLWAFRNMLPDGKRPFENFESIFRTLESLDLESSNFRYFPRIQTAASQDSDGESESDASWLKIAASLDETARILIRHCLTLAVKDAADKSKDWIELAESISEEKEPDVLTIQFLTGDGEQDDPDQLKNANIEMLIGKLESFVSFAQVLRDHFHEQLNRS